MDTDSTASSGQQSTYESDDALEDIGVLFKDSLGKPTICCWNEAEICEIIHDNHETVQLVSLGRYREVPITATFNRRLLTRLSPYFTALLEGGFSESTKNVLPLDSYPYELRIFEEWVSTGIVTFTSKWFCDWMSLYVFADYYDLPAFGRDIMSFLVEQRDKSQLFFFIGTYLDYVPSSSPLYRFCVEVCVHHLDCDRNLGRGGYEKLPKEFMWDVITGLSNKSANKPCPCCHKHCDFHKHDSEEEWQKTCQLTNPGYAKPDPSTYRKLPLGRQRWMNKSA